MRGLLSDTVQINVTISGRTCQRWDSLEPHVHPYVSYGSHNYCGKPDGANIAWCYTTDSDQVMEYCNEFLRNGL